jgi:hypothetical protein
MNGTRKAGLIVAGVAAAMWLGAVLGFVATGPEDGVNIGAALLALLAVPVSMAASITLLISLRADRHGRPRSLLVAAGLAGLSLVALPAFLLLDPYETSVVAQLGVLGIGVLAFLASSALFAVASRRNGQPLPAGTEY